MELAMRALSTSTRAQLTVRAPTLLARQQRGRLFDAGAGVTGARPRLSVTTSHARGINTSGINSAQPGTLPTSSRASLSRPTWAHIHAAADVASVNTPSSSRGPALARAHDTVRLPCARHADVSRRRSTQAQGERRPGGCSFMRKSLVRCRRRWRPRRRRKAWCCTPSRTATVGC
jgi:hypothetical protein